jgi:hypothetical protein
MGIAEIQAPPTTPDEMLSWSFVHMAHHRDIVRRIQETKSVNLTEYPLDYFSPEGTRGTNWLYNHAVMHNQMDQVLGIQGFNLNSLDWQDPDSVATWFDQHAAEHQQAGELLSIG